MIATDIGRERMLIGSLLANTDAIDDVLPMVTVDDFRDHLCRVAYRAIGEMWNAGGMSIDLAAVVARVESFGEFSEKFPGWLWECYEHAGTGGNAGHYAQRVKDASTKFRLLHAAEEIAQDAKSPTGSAEELVADAEKRIHAIADSALQNEAVEIGTLVNDALERYDARYSRGTGCDGLKTGYPELDAFTGGFQPSTLTIVGARPSVGKTALAINLAFQVASRNNVPVCIFSLEQSSESLTDRMICMAAGVDATAWRQSKLPSYEAARAAGVARSIQRMKIMVDGSVGQRVTRIAAQVRKIKRRHGLGLVVIDYLQLIEPENRRDQRYVQIGEISRRLQILSRDQKLPILCLSQLNRAKEDRADGKPRLSDLRESGNIEQDADVVFLLHRDGENENVVHLNIAKQRDGPTGEVQFYFRRTTGRFENYDGIAE